MIAISSSTKGKMYRVFFSAYSKIGHRSDIVCVAQSKRCSLSRWKTCVHICTSMTFITAIDAAQLQQQVSLSMTWQCDSMFSTLYVSTHSLNEAYECWAAHNASNDH